MNDSTIYPAGTVDSVGKNMSDSTIYPADTVDINGNVWPTIGENIRNGMFGENVKVGYVNINNGNITSPNLFIIETYDLSFKISRIRVFYAFVEDIKSGNLEISIENTKNNVVIHNTKQLKSVVGSIKIIYKELV